MTHKESIQSLVDDVVDGRRSAAEAYAMLYDLAKFIDQAISVVKEEAIVEVARYGKDGISMHGYQMQSKNAAGRWNYNNVSIRNKLLEKVKTIEELAKAASKTDGVVTDENGEIIEPAVYLAGGETIICTKLK